MLIECPLSLDEVEVELSRRQCKSLSAFVRQAWPVLEPGQPYVHGWHADAVCEHLEAITRGQITRLLINIPPGTSKSTLVSVMWPAWEWGPQGMPSKRFIGASHEQGLAIRDAMKMRHLVTSDWYRDRWPVNLLEDQNQKLNFQNDKTGFRQACAVASMTGRRGDSVVWDDPHSVEDAHSKAQLEAAIRVFRETLPTRLNNPDRSAIIIVMQRLHESDVAGEILANDLGYDHLCLPMEWEAPRKATSIGFVDPRTEVGELLFPARFPRAVVDRDKKVMGAYAVAGQLQQRPSPPGGEEFQPDMIGVIDALPAGRIRWCRGWDLGATEGAGSYTAGVKVGLLEDGRVVFADARREQFAVHKRDAFIKATAQQDGKGILQSLPQDPGQAGKTQVAGFAALLIGHECHFSTESGEKTVRARPLASQVNAGNAVMVRGAWNRDFTDELRTFPNGLYSDQVDAASRGFAALLQPQAKSGVFF